MTTVRRALVISFIERYALIALSLASNILIARLLSPEEIGLYSVSLAVIGIVQILRDFGVGSYLIQEKNLTHEHIQTAFGISLLMGGILFLFAFFGASLVGNIYSEPRIVSTLRICAFNFLVLPFCTVSLALLRREMQFQKVLYVTLIATAIGFVVTIALAYAGYGANSMALGTLMTNIVTGLAAWIARGSQAIMLPSLLQWRTVASFGAQRSAASLAGTMSTDLIELVSGKILGFVPVAILSRAQGLMNLFQRDLLTAISGVALPAFAKSNRENVDLESLHLKTIAAITVFAWPFYSFVSLFPLEILRALFGNQWDQAANFVLLYCLGGAITAPSYLIGTLLTAIGRIDVATKIELTLHPLKAAFFIVGLVLFPTIETLPTLYVVATICATPYCFHMKGKVLPNNNPKLLKTLTQSFFVTLISMAAPFALKLLIGRTSNHTEFYWVILAAVFCAVGWVGGLYIVRHPITKDPLFLGTVQRLACFLQITQKR